MRLLILLRVAIATVSAASSQTFNYGMERLSLDAASSANIWTASGFDSSGNKITVPATVPGGIYSDLEEHGIFQNAIYHEFNDIDNKWVGRSPWTFTRSFNVAPSLLEKSKVVIVCEGLDTIGEVFINDMSVGKSDNMFARFIFDIRSVLREGENTIRIEFRSPVEYVLTQNREHEEKYGYKVAPERLSPEFKGENQAQMIRKIQSQFSWDWGPAYPNTGIWKNIFIEGYNGAVVRDVMIFSVPSKPIPDETSATQWKVTARVYYDSAVDDPYATLTFQRQESPEEAWKTVRLEGGSGKYVDVSITESGTNTKLWWPNGYGDQNLYGYNVSLSSQEGTESSTRLFRIGFRTAELIEDFVDPQNQHLGREFYFKVNGQKMYSKGSNSIPLHVLPERITKEQTEWLLRAAKMSHQNMIRIWGGGMYETEDFMDFADEYGIFIWQDFMFACAMYPVNPEFLDTVRREVETQVRRLQYRTSLVMWAGNNEIEGGATHGWFAQQNVYQDYKKLYIETIKPMVEKMDPSRPFLPSSPTNGKKTMEEGGIAQDPYDLAYGDFHIYDYRADNWDWKIYPRTRYASEYGYQSFPHYETLSEVADDIKTWTWNSPMMQHRQRHPGGQEEIRKMIQTHLPYPRNHDSTEAFPYMLYMSQITQIMGQKTQTEFYRRNQDKLNVDGHGHTMGALYWQLNDIWQGCSWASVEISGRWKLQMYYAMNFFAPVLASLYRDLSGDVVIEMISDSTQTYSDYLIVQIFKLHSLKPVFEEGTVVQAEFLTSKEVFRIPNSKLASLGCDGEAKSGTKNPCVVYVTAPNTPDNFLFLQYPKNKLALKDPGHKVHSVISLDSNAVQFTLTTQAVAPFVLLTVRGDYRGFFSDNGFLQLADKRLTYYSENGISAEQFLDRIEVMSLYNVTAVAGDVGGGYRDNNFQWRSPNSGYITIL